MLSARQQHCLRGIGVPVWRARGDAAVDALTEKQPVPFDSAMAAEAVDTASETPGPAAAPRIEAPAEAAAPGVPAAPVAAPKLDSWDAIVEAIHACQACELAQNCTQKVPGVGDRQADLLIVGEGPGHDEDIQGEPFVGRSGQLLDRMLAAIGFSREQVYITNIVKCRPPNNRDPRPEEARHCRAFLEAQIERIAPRAILSVGRVSAHNLLGSDQPVAEIPLKVTYHPAYLLRNPSAKAIAWQDLKLLHRMLR